MLKCSVCNTNFLFKLMKTKPWKLGYMIYNVFISLSFCGVLCGPLQILHISKPEEIFSKLNSFLHHVDFKSSGLNLIDIKKMVSEKKILYDHFADQRKIDKWNSPIVLQPVEISFLPDYIICNKEKFKSWLE